MPLDGGRHPGDAHTRDTGALPTDSGAPLSDGGSSDAATNLGLRAADFTDSVGVGVHMGASNYSNVADVTAALKLLQTKHVRDSIGGTYSLWAEKYGGDGGFASIGVYSDALFGGPLAVSERVQANYLLDAIVDGFSLGVVRTYIYELLDAPSVEGMAGSEQNHFGLFEYPLGSPPRPKIAGTAVANLMTILQDSSPNARTFPSGVIPFTLARASEGGPPVAGDGPYSLLLEKASGTFELVLWFEPAGWSIADASPIPTPVETVTVTVTSTYDVNIYDPMVSSAPMSHASQESRVTLTLTDHPLVVELLGH